MSTDKSLESMMGKGNHFSRFQR